MKFPLSFVIFLAFMRAACADIGEVGNGYSGIVETRELHPRSGQLATEEPEMSHTDAGPWPYEAFTVTPLYRYDITARVLAKEHYINDMEARLVPYDLVLGWQEMSDSDVIRQIEISQSDRWYHLHWRGAVKGIDTKTLSLKSGNMHIIPGSDEVLAELEQLAKGNVIRIKGYLVQVKGPGIDWRSGIGPDAQGPKGCKLIWVEKLEVER